MSDKSTRGTSWTRRMGDPQHVLENNLIRLDADWREETVGGKNRIHVRFYVCVRYRISGSWDCSFDINGQRVLSRLKKNLSQGNMTDAWTSEVFVAEKYVDVDKSMKSTTIKLYVHDFDYKSVTTGAWTKKDFTQEFLILLTNNAIIPYDPQITINKPDDNNGRNNYETLQLNGNGISGWFRVYPCQTSPGSGVGNKLQFYIAMPGNGSHTRIRIGKYVNGQGWNENFYDSGWRATTYHKYEMSFYSTDRYDKGVAWKVWSMVKSSTGNEKSSETIWFVFNDQPCFSGHQPNISCSSIVVPGTSNLHVSWNSCVNSIYQSVYTLRYKLSDSSTWTNVYTSSATNATIDLSNQSIYSRGKTIEFQVKAQDKYDEDTEFRGTKTVKINSLPLLSSTFISNNMSDPNTYNNHYDNNVTFTLPNKSDADGQNTFYKIYYKVGNGNWITYNSNYTGSKTLTINCSNYQNSAGGSFQLKATVNDGLEDGTTATSSVIYKNTKPSIPSNINYNPTNAIHSNTHAETINSISWNGVNNVCNNRPVSRYEVVKKTANTTSSNGTNKATYNPTTNNCSVNIDDITRGEYFWFEIAAIDIFGYRSDTYVTTKYKRNQAPYAPSQFVINQQQSQVHKTVPLTWVASTDPDGDTVKYKLEVKKGTSSYEVVSNSITNTNYTHDITGYEEGISLTYRITPYDEHNVYGPSVETTQNIFVNVKPRGVNILHPTHVIYNVQPRILFEVLTNKNKDLTLIINVNGTDYISNKNSDYFCNSNYRTVTKGVFKGPTLKIGTNVIKAKTYDGYQYSDEKTFIVTINNSPLQNINSGDIILNEHMKGLNTMISNYYVAYGCVFNKKDSLTLKETTITSLQANNMYDNIMEINNTINNFSDDTKFDKVITKNTISSGTSIKKEINDINTILLNL